MWEIWLPPTKLCHDRKTKDNLNDQGTNRWLNDWWCGWEFILSPRINWHVFRGSFNLCFDTDTKLIVLSCDRSLWQNLCYQVRNQAKKKREKKKRREGGYGVYATAEFILFFNLSIKICFNNTSSLIIVVLSYFSTKVCRPPHGSACL